MPEELDQQSDVLYHFLNTRYGKDRIVTVATLARDFRRSHSSAELDAMGFPTDDGTSYEDGTIRRRVGQVLDRMVKAKRNTGGRMFAYLYRPGFGRYMICSTRRLDDYTRYEHRPPRLVESPATRSNAKSVPEPVQPAPIPVATTSPTAAPKTFKGRTIKVVYEGSGSLAYMARQVRKVVDRALILETDVIDKEDAS